MSVDWPEFDRRNRLDLPNFIEGRAMYLDKRGEPIGLFTWAKLNEDRSYSQIGNTEMMGYRISTVWLGLDHSFSFAPDAPPIIFETMIFTPLWVQHEIGGHRWLIRESANFQWRYSTEAEAMAGHWIATELIRAELSNRAITGRRRGAPRELRQVEEEPWTITRSLLLARAASTRL